MKNPELHQWHSTSKVRERGVFYFLKKYDPNSYEIKNEVSWLTSKMVASCGVFRTPRVIQASIAKGEVKMEYISAVERESREDIVTLLTESAVALHNLVNAERPHLRNPVSHDQYNEFLQDYTQKRIDAVGQSEFELHEEVAEWIIREIAKLKTSFYTIVHRDLRSRHLLFPDGDEKKPVLVDWEFTNISEPAQDLAKLIYDGVVQHGSSRDELMGKVIDIYSYERKISPDAIMQKVKIFLPIIPLEHAMSFINRRPAGYKEEVLKDLLFIKSIYEEQK